MRRFWRAFFQVWHPLHPRGGYIAPHLTLAALAVAVLAFAGVFATYKYTAQYYRTHENQSGIVVPNIRVPLTGSAHVPLPSTDAVHYTYLNHKPGEQGIVNACTAWSFAKEASYAVNWISHGGVHEHVFFAPRWYYDLVANGRNVSTSATDYPNVSQRFGSLYNHQFPYPPNPTDADVEPAPFRFNSQTTKVPLWNEWLYGWPGVGSEGIYKLKLAIHTKHLPSVGVKLYPHFNDAGVTGYYDLPAYKYNTDAGHDMVAVRYDDNLVYNNVRGWVLFQNQYGPYYGVGFDGKRHDGPNNGYVWISYRFLEVDSWAAVVTHYGNAPTGSGRYVPSKVPTHKAPPVPRDFTIPTGGNASYQVHNVITRDTGVDISKAINDSARYYGFSPVGYAALIGTESGYHQYAPHYPIPGAGPCDYSPGLVQITVCTAATLGVGDGSESQQNINYVFWYEQQDAVREVWLGAKLLAQFQSHTCGLPFPELYRVWNYGDGYGCSGFYLSYHGGIGDSNYNNYLSNWSYAWYHYAYVLQPYVFPRSTWGPLSPYWCRSKGHCGYSWAASVFARHQDLGRALDYGRHYGSKTRGYTKTRFSHGNLFCWNLYHRCKVAVYGRPPVTGGRYFNFIGRSVSFNLNLGTGRIPIGPSFQ